ncbi:ATP-binding protein [Adlercreutzia sp. R25]|uniref:ATP-binding protein n=1 Tax=Adlercreutzia shanghongiae TaxID=3111773 RepID=A0ABU6IVN9_9ACTN|nr:MULTISPECIES: ATP-binding protein [unclassified Adlercreutzia]MEC4272178.1 ATP-binding protein [Adlercreutzia sp. R25]MEC4293901.1 ATP-binding protein [Adlercreutzia sp. R22]
MTPEELERIVKRLRRQGCDDAQVEVKACRDALSKDVWESVSAFGNTRGGIIILGLEENEGFRPVPGFKLNRVRDQFVSGLEEGGNAKPKIRNMPQYDLERIDFEGAQVLVIEISEVEARFKPCYLRDRGLSNGAFKRVDDKDIKLSPTEIFELQHLFEPSPADREAVKDSSVEDLDQMLVDRLLTREKERGSRALRGTDDRSVHLKRLNVTTASGALSLAGLMGLGAYPQEYFPKLVVDVTVHPGIEKSEPEGPRFLDRIICEGPIGEAVDEAVIAVSRNLRTYSYIEGSGRHDELEIPRDVLREAIANAVIHREYSSFFVGQSVSVDIFADRIEVTNPGGLWGGKTLETLGDGQSRCRNSSLMQLVSRTEYSAEGAPVEGQGSGVRLMIREMQSHALDEPRFEAGIDFFKVVLQRGGAEIASNREWMDNVTARPMSSAERAVLLEARREKQVSVRKLHQRLGYDSDEIRLALGALEGDGLLKKVSKDKYELFRDDGELPKTPKVSAREAIIDVLENAESPMSMREIAEMTGRKIATLRAQMAHLVSEGLVVPTASSTDTSRKYVIK